MVVVEGVGGETGAEELGEDGGVVGVDGAVEGRVAHVRVAVVDVVWSRGDHVGDLVFETQVGERPDG